MEAAATTVTTSLADSNGPALDSAILHVLSSIAKLPDGTEKQQLKRKLIQGIIAFSASQEDREHAFAINKDAKLQRSLEATPPSPSSLNHAAPSSPSSTFSRSMDSKSPPIPPASSIHRWRRLNPVVAAEADAVVARRAQTATLARARDKIGSVHRDGEIVLPTHPRELARGIEILLSLKEKYLATMKEKMGGMSTIVEPLHRRMSQYQEYFLSGVQTLKKGTACIHSFGGVDHRLWLDDKGEFLFWRDINSYNKATGEKEAAFQDAPTDAPETGMEDTGGRFSLQQPFVIIACIPQYRSNASMGRASIRLVPLSPPPEHVAFEAMAGPFEFRDAEEGLLWMITLASIRFSYWWKDTDGGKKKSESASRIVGQSHLQLWQAARVSLMELTKIPTCSLREAWALVDGTMGALRQGTPTPWELPLYIDDEIA